MAFTLQAFKTDTLASQMASGATSGTLSSGNFTNFTQDYLVLDYNNPTLREGILCNVTGTVIASATRGVYGSAQTHAAGASVAYAFVPAHYANGLGAIAANDAWTATNIGTTGWSVTQAGRYQQIGKTVYLYFSISATSNSTSTTFTLPVACKSTVDLLIRVSDNGGAFGTGLLETAAGTTTCNVYSTIAGGVWTATGTKAVSGSLIYEAA